MMTEIGSSRTSTSNPRNVTCEEIWNSKANGLKCEQLVVLETLICRKHDDLQLVIQDLLKQHMKLMDLRVQSHCEQMALLNGDLQNQSKQMKLLNFHLEEHSGELLKALKTVSFSSYLDPRGSLTPPEDVADVIGIPDDHGPPSATRRLATGFLRVEPCGGDQSNLDPLEPDHNGHVSLPIGEIHPAATFDNICIDDIILQDGDTTSGRLDQSGGREFNEYGLSRSVAQGNLTPGFSNLHFAGDLLQAFSNHHLSDLRLAMRQCELPRHKGKSGSWQTEPSRESFMARILTSAYFEYWVCVVILANTCFITYSTDYAVANPYNQDSTLIITVETIFQVYYILELLVKLQVHRLYFFWNRDYSWNILDFCLAVSAVYDLIMTRVSTGLAEGSPGTNNGFSFVFFRLLRLVRLMKVMRIFRVMRFFNELHVLLKVVKTSLRPLFWCSLIFMVFIYMFAVIFAQGTASYLAHGDTRDATKAALIKHFGSVKMSMLSLSEVVTGGKEWGKLAEPLQGAGPIYYVLYLIFIGFCYLALTNILTGLFVDRTFKTVADDHDGLALEKLHSDRGVVADLCRFFCAMTGADLDFPASISEEVFLDFMKSPVMRARLSVLDLEVWDSTQFFRMLTSISQTDELDLKCWVTGCMQLRGLASRISVQAVHADLQRLKRRYALHSLQQRAEHERVA